MYELPELPYGYDALEPYVSRELIELHHDAHHAAYVNGANGRSLGRARLRMGSIVVGAAWAAATCRAGL